MNLDWLQDMQCKRNTYYEVSKIRDMTDMVWGGGEKGEGDSVEGIIKGKCEEFFLYSFHGVSRKGERRERERGC